MYHDQEGPVRGRQGWINTQTEVSVCGSLRHTVRAREPPRHPTAGERIKNTVVYPGNGIFSAKKQ